MLFSRRRKARPVKPSRRPRLGQGLHFEALEDRNLLAVGLLHDVAPNAGNSNAERYVQLGNLTFFTANDNTNGVELWMTDGTDAGTEMLMDIAPGAPSSSPEELTVFDGKLYFTANDQVHGRELWVTDGTVPGTQLVIDIDNIASSSPDYLTVVGDELMFSAYDPTNGDELWRFDGTTASMVSDLRPGSFGSTPDYLTEVDGTLFFSANNADSIGRELWRYDAVNGIQLVRNIADLSFESGNPQELTAVGDLLFFTAVGPSDNYFGRELYVSDGTTNGTYMVQDINPGVADSTPLYLHDANGELWFSATTAAAGRELWRSDGTSPNTEIVNDYTPGSGGSNPISMVYQTAGVFVHYDTYNYIVYFPDSGPVEYRGNNLYLGSPLVAGDGYLYFSRANAGFNYELWQINTTTRAVTLLQEINPSAGSYPTALTFLNGSLYFTANDGTNGQEPWLATFNPVVSISGLPGSNTGPEGTAINVSANITGPGAGGPYTYAWSVTKQGAGSPFATGTSSSFSFTPDDNGTYDLSLTVTDSADQDGIAQQALTITNAVPTATIVGAPTASNVANQINLTSSVTDPGALDTTFTYAWTVMVGGNQVASGALSTFSFIPEIPGSYDVSLSVTDDDTGNDTDQATITITYTTNQNIVAKLYQDLLGRAPEFDGLLYWATQLNNGYLPGQMLGAIKSSYEYRAQRVEAVYQQYLGRSADSGAIPYWAAFIDERSELDFQLAILTSDEYRNAAGSDAQYIQALYQDILGRPADSGGETFWLDVLDGPNGPAQVVMGLLTSRESYASLLDDAYLQFLGRHVDPASETYWLDQLSSGEITFDGLYAKIVNSPEYMA
jgi:ELWxxDGT repeat protein